jgi:hypothetical protein
MSCRWRKKYWLVVNREEEWRIASLSQNNHIQKPKNRSTVLYILKLYVLKPKIKYSRWLVYHSKTNSESTAGCRQKVPFVSPLISHVFELENIYCPLGKEWFAICNFSTYYYLDLTLERH